MKSSYLYQNLTLGLQEEVNRHFFENPDVILTKMEVQAMNDFFTVNQLAEYFRVNPKTVYRRLWAKQIPAYKVGRRGELPRKISFG